MINRRAWFSSGSRGYECDDRAHTGAAYSAVKYYRDSAVVLIVLAFVPHLEFASFFGRLFGMVTFKFLFCMCCL